METKQWWTVKTHENTILVAARTHEHVCWRTPHVGSLQTSWLNNAKHKVEHLKYPRQTREVKDLLN